MRSPNFQFPPSLPLEKAVREAERDCRACLERVAEEASQLESVGRLEDVREAVRESINDEISELEMIRDQCAKDARTIGKRDTGAVV